MDFLDVVDQVVALLRSRGRITYRALKRQFHLDDDALEDLKAEIISGQRLAVDEERTVLVWTDGEALTPAPLGTTGERPEGQSTDVISLPAMSYQPDAERRQLTVMFCDLADSTILSSQLDPEDLRAVLRAYQQTSAEVVQRYEGHIAQYLGDGLLVYFGWPQAHEDDAQRAVHAGLGIVTAMQRLNTRLQQDKGMRLAVRIGLHTGPVVVGEMGGGGRHEHLALGDTPNIAARLQSLAAPDTVAVSATTFHLIQGYFVCDELGSYTLKGVPAPMPVYRVQHASGAQSRLEVAVTHGLTPLIGREQEVALLQERWGQVTEGFGQVILLSGEAGIGKSRLVHMLKEHVAPMPHTRLECRTSPYYRNTALYPLTDLLHRTLAFTKDDTAAQQLEKLEQALRTVSAAAHRDGAALCASPVVTGSRRRDIPLRACRRSGSDKNCSKSSWRSSSNWRPRSLWCLSSKTCTGSIPRHSTSSACWWIRDPLCVCVVCGRFVPILCPPGRDGLTSPPSRSPVWRPSRSERLITTVAGGKPLPAAVVQQIMTTYRWRAAVCRRTDENSVGVRSAARR